ncbi:MAG TPA: hypothetical protein VJZ27_13655, partial [Aggregatilineales bacterium]|nr:hypothetical protein [Aggregatilineales bacterium]
MRGLSWNLRIVLGLALLVILAAIVFFIYYTVVRLDRDGPIDVDTYPNASVVNEESIGEDGDHIQYVSNAPDVSPGGVTQHALDIEKFYR